MIGLVFTRSFPQGEAPSDDEPSYPWLDSLVTRLIWICAVLFVLAFWYFTFWFCGVAL